MNLFIESLAEYLKQEWDSALHSMNGRGEARFIVQSLDPSAVLSLFEILDSHRLVWLKQHNIKCYFRVATELWQDWSQTRNADAQLRQKLHDKNWIDEEDRLTWYRNRTVKNEEVDGLVIVLVGLDHATDQGGLADFHRVDEPRIWHEMGESFIPWLKRINKRLDLNASDMELEQFDMVLQQLFQIRPLRLGKLADFLEHNVIAGEDFISFAEFTGQFFQQLPFWGIPPLFATEQTGELRGKKGAIALKEADAFITHQRYKSSAGQRKDWQKIVKALNEDEEEEFELPVTLSNEKIYEKDGDYLETLRAFIFEADAIARSRLLHTDFMPLLTILRKRAKSPGTGTRKTMPSINGMNFEVLLQGIWQTLEVFAKNCGGQPLAEQLGSIHVELIRFDHDLTADDDAGIGSNGLASELLQGCLGGLDKVFESIDCRLPQDEDQALLPNSQWAQKTPITLDLALDSLIYGTSRQRPNIQFKVTVASIDGDLNTEQKFKWVFGPTQPERVRFECAKQVRDQWRQSSKPSRLLPMFQIPSVAMTAFYFSADEDEANRLITQAMPKLNLVNLLDDLPVNMMDPALWDLTNRLIEIYRDWLDNMISKGYFTALEKQGVQLVNAFVDLAEKSLDSNLLGATELLERLYRTFLVVDENTDASGSHLSAAIAWGLSLPILELTQARVRFLADGFPEALGELVIRGEGKTSFERLLNLSQIQRPLAALVTNLQQLSAEIKSFGLLHYLGPEPSGSKSLAVQTLLRDEESNDNEDVKKIIRPCEERDLVNRVLSDYQQLYPFAEDGLRILAVNIRELQTILAGVDRFLETYLKRSSPDWPPFHCSIMVYSTSSSPMAMENRLALWRNHVLERQREKGRPLILTVGHRYAPREQVVGLLKQEQRLYDIVFLFHFLRSGLVGRVDSALPFAFNFGGSSGLQFPIAEYPRPIKAGRNFRRQSLLSNRRLRIQTRHADLSARLLGYTNDDHVIIGEVDYQPWAEVVKALHGQAHWVVCVDPFVDKRLLYKDDRTELRKIVGFTSGLGAYGELNLTISTEQDTLKQLTDQVAGKLTKLLPFEQTDGFEAMAARVVTEAEEIIGLASLRAVVGIDERIREVVGFAAIRRALAVPMGQISQLLPLDSLQHWFTDDEVSLRPDLLQLTLEVRPDDIPLVHAVVVECKLAQQSQVHFAKAYEQVQEGLRHLTGLLAPEHAELRRLGFDRRYWWAQLHRAMTSRAVVTLPQNAWRELDHALERLAEGEFEIRWQGVIFTFWTNEAGPLPEISLLGLPAGTVKAPFKVDEGFVIQHLALGYQGLTELFGDTQPSPLLKLVGPSIGLRSQHRLPDEGYDGTEMPPDIPVKPPGYDGTEMPPDIPVKPPGYDGTEMPPDIPVKPPGYDGTEMPPDMPVKLPGDGGTKITPVLLVPEKVLIGTRNNGKSVYWHYGHTQLANRHLLIFGSSGSGKTYAIQCLLAEMAQQQLHSLIVDYTDGFLPQQVEARFKEMARPQNHYVVTEKLPLNPFRRQSQIIDPSIPAIEESPYQVATRIASIFDSIFEMGDQQSAALIRVLQAGIEEEPEFTLDGVLPRLRADSSNGESLANKLEPLIRAEPFQADEESAWEGMLASANNRVHVLQLKGLAREIQKMVTEFVLWDLWDYAQNTGGKNRPIPIVLDEIQNLDHRSDSPIDKMLREGRKFGLSLMLATQTTSQFNQEQRDRLFQAGHKLFFKPATTETDRFAQLLAQATVGISKADWTQRLSSLEKGQCWSLGPIVRSGGSFKEDAVLVNVTSLEERIFEDE